MQQVRRCSIAMTLLIRLAAVHRACAPSASECAKATLTPDTNSLTKHRPTAESFHPDAYAEDFPGRCYPAVRHPCHTWNRWQSRFRHLQNRITARDVANSFVDSVRMKRSYFAIVTKGLTLMLLRRENQCRCPTCFSIIQSLRSDDIMIPLCAD